MPPTAAPTPAPAVEFNAVTFRYAPGAPPALEDITIDVDTGELLAVVGPNGGGKSTLLKIMLGLLPGYEGTVRVLGMSPEAARRQGLIGWVPQKSESRSGFPVSARDVVTMGAGWRTSGWRRLPTDVRQRVDQAIEVVGAADYADRPVGRLSGGQTQRVLIARALASGAKILALDEPTVGIDAVGQNQFADLLRRLHRQLGLTILLVSHDLRTIAGGASTCDRVACLRRKLHFHAAPMGITPQVLAQVFQHDLAGVFGDVHVDAHAASECAHDHGDAHDHGQASLVVTAPKAGTRPAPRSGDVGEGQRP